MSLLLAVWREASRQTAIDEAAERIARLLPGHLPADVLVIRRLDLEQRRLETVTAVPCRGIVAPPARTRTELEPDQVEALLAWAHRGQVLRDSPRRAGTLAALLAPPGAASDLTTGESHL